MDRMVRLLFLTVSLCASHLYAQRQLVVISGDKALHNFKVGDNFHSQWKGDKNEHWGFLVEVGEFSVITSQDTIELRKIEKVLIPGKPFIHRVGKTLVKVGLVYFVIDQLNNTLVQHHNLSLDPDVWKPSLIMVSAGLPLLLFRKNWKNVSKRMRLKSVDYESRLYLVD